MHYSLCSDPSTSLKYFLKTVNNSFSPLPDGKCVVLFPIAAIHQILVASLAHLPKKEDPKLEEQLKELTERVRWYYGDSSREQGDLLTQILFTRAHIGSAAGEYAERKLESIAKELPKDYPHFKRDKAQQDAQHPKGRLVDPIQQLDAFRRLLIQLGTDFENGKALPGFSAKAFQDMSIFSEEFNSAMHLIADANLLAAYAHMVPDDLILDPKKLNNSEFSYAASKVREYVANKVREYVKEDRQWHWYVPRKTCIVMIPAEAITLRNTQYRLDNLGITFLPRALNKVSVEKIGLSWNNLGTFPEDLFRVYGLKVICLGYNGIEKLPETINKLWALTKLSLENNKLTTLPATFSQLTGLETLILNSNPLKQYPAVLAPLFNLRTLGLYHTGLEEFPEFGNTNLTDLNVGGNSFVEVATSIGRLTGLTRLEINAGRNLERIDALKQVYSLVELSCDSQLLPKFPETTHLPNLTTVICGTETVWTSKSAQTFAEFLKQKRLASKSLW